MLGKEETQKMTINSIDENADYQAFVQRHYMSFMNAYMQRYPNISRQEAHIAFKKYYNQRKRMEQSNWGYVN